MYKNNTQLDIKNFKEVKEINRGGFGSIHLVKDINSGEELVAKINYQTGNESDNKKFVSREIKILSKVQHPTIIKFRGLSYVDFYNNKNVTIFMDYMSKGSLLKLLENEEKGLAYQNYDDTKRQIILAGIARGMMILHSHHIIHRDLKPENILLDQDLKPKITDFGLSKFYDPSHSQNQSMQGCGTISYMAPEVIRSNHYNTKADVYSFGILMYEVISCTRAHSSIISKKNFNSFSFSNKVANGFRPEFNFPIKKGLKQIIELCWSQNPIDRPTFSEIFAKLSLSQEDYYFQYEQSESINKIKPENDESEDQDEFAYCLDGVDYDEFMNYISEITENDTEDNESEKSNTISTELLAKIESIEQAHKEDIQKMTNIIQMKDIQIKEQTKQINDQFNIIKDQESQIEKLTQIVNQQMKMINNSKDNSLKFYYDDKKKNHLDGIINYLNNKTNGIVSLNNVIKVTASSSQEFRGNTLKVENLCNFNNLISDYGWSPNNQKKAFIQFDFGHRKVKLTHYTLHTPEDQTNEYPKSWIVECSNDSKSWITVDSKSDQSVMNNFNVAFTFECNNMQNAFFQYIKITSTGPCWSGPKKYYFDLAAVEFFGYLDE